MVKLRFSTDRLVELTGLEVDVLKDALFRLKCEVDESQGTIDVEVNPDRPDMFSAEGIGRAVRGITAIELGWSPPETVTSGLKLVNESPSSRPFIGGAVVYGVNVDEQFLVELIQFQEKLHDTLGRRRRKVAIGIHDLSKVRGRRLTYKLVGLDASMTPLGSSSRMTIKEVLASTEQGIKYGGLSVVELEGRPLHPAIMDEEGNIISLPPVINSELTRVEVGTRDLFIDVTGVDEQAVNQVLNVLVSNLAEREGARLGTVVVTKAGQGDVARPALELRPQRLELEYVNRVLGTDLTIDEASFALLKMRYPLDESSLAGNRLTALVPPFRVDVLGQIDLVEDVAIALGYDSPKLSPVEPVVVPNGQLSLMSRLVRKSRDLMVGLGFTELLSYLLTSYNVLRLMDLSDIAVRVKNPVQSDLDALRPSLAPSILTAMAYNVRKRKPVKLFEIGKVVVRDAAGVAEDRRLGVGLMDDSVGYEDVQAVAYSYLRSLGLTPTAAPLTSPRFMLGGRSAQLMANGVPIGVIGEVRPDVLEALNIDYPVAFFELSLVSLSQVITNGNSGQVA